GRQVRQRFRPRRSRALPLTTAFAAKAPPQFTHKRLIAAMIEHQFYEQQAPFRAQLTRGIGCFASSQSVEFSLRSGIAQLVEQRPVKAMVGGSSPPAGAAWEAR